MTDLTHLPAIMPVDRDQVVRTATTLSWTHPAPHPALDDPDTWSRTATDLLAAPLRARRSPVVAVLRIVEGDRLGSRFGRRGLDELLDQLAWLVDGELTEHDRMSLDGHGGLRLLCATPRPRRPRGASPRSWPG